MKKIARDLTLFTARTDSRKVRLALFLLTLGMFVLSAGAPDATGGIGLNNFTYYLAH